MESIEIKMDEDFQEGEAHFFKLFDIQYLEETSTLKFYNKYRDLVVAGLKKKGDNIMWKDGLVLAEDEVLSPTFEELILAVVLGLIDTRLPSHVWDHYHPLLGDTKSIMDYKMDILAEVPSFLNMMTDELPAVCKGDEDPPYRYSNPYWYLLKQTHE